MIPRPRPRPTLLNPVNPSQPASVQQPTEPPVAWKTVFLSAAVGGAAFYLVNKLLSSAERKIFPEEQSPAQAQLPAQPQPVQNLPPPPPGYAYVPTSPPPLPNMMQPYGYQPPTQVFIPQPQPAPQAGGLTESDLHAWAHELEGRETDLERREATLKAEQRRLRLVS